LRLARHPHIVELTDAFERDRFLFLVMEHVSGGELFSAFADPCVSVTESCVGAVGYQLFQALRHLHDLRVIHRDVKAENILLTCNPAKTNAWHVKLIDFGLAIRMETTPCIFRMCREQDVPFEDLICGTAYYCAPEVWINDYGPKVDVWAAGVVLYLALLGNFPFYDRNQNVVEEMICNIDLRPTYMAASMAGLSYQVTDKARDCLEALLVKDHTDRLTSAAALNHRWLKDSVNLAKDQPDRIRRSSHSERNNARQRQAERSAPRSQSALLSNERQLANGDQVIPLTVRSKAGRAAARAPVDVSMERSRTAALEGLKQQRPPDSCMRKVGPTAARTAWRSQSRDVEVPQKDREGRPPEASLSDSDVEDAGSFCCQ
jgi:serine/threonine protein kinase